MITCHVRYLIDPAKLTQFEHYAKLWIPLVQCFGNQHYGYFLPFEVVNKVALTTGKTLSHIYETHRHLRGCRNFYTFPQVETGRVNTTVKVTT